MDRDIEVLMNSIATMTREVEIQINQAKLEADSMGCELSQIRSTDGSWIFNDLLVAKVNLLHSRVLLMQMKGS